MKGWKFQGTKLLAGIGLICFAIAILEYWRYGFNANLWMLYATGSAALVLAGFSAYGPEIDAQPEPKKGRQAAAPYYRRHLRDIILAGVLLLVLAPLYLYNVHDFPRQVNSDEVAIMNAEAVLSASPNVDIYG